MSGAGPAGAAAGRAASLTDVPVKPPPRLNRSAVSRFAFSVAVSLDVAAMVRLEDAIRDQRVTTTRMSAGYAGPGKGPR